MHYDYWSVIANDWTSVFQMCVCAKEKVRKSEGDLEGQPVIILVVISTHDPT